MNTQLAKLESNGVGHRGFDDELFKEDPPPPRYGICDEDLEDEDQLECDVELIPCQVPGCTFSGTLREFEAHYNTRHRYTCANCKKIMPSPHLLDLHVQETHDSFFAVMAARKPSYSCYIEECKEKFQTPEERSDHCTEVHKLPKDFRFKVIPKSKKPYSADMDVPGDHKRQRSKPFKLSCSRHKVFTSENKSKRDKQPMDIDAAMKNIKDSLPE